MLLPEVHYGPGPAGECAHKGSRKNCTYPDCAWPREGDMGVGTCAADGKERAGEIVGLNGHLPVICTSEGTEWPVLDLREQEPYTMHCPHGLKVVEPVPAEHDEGCQEPRPLCTLGRNDPFHQCPEPRYCPACYPTTRVIDPWPCTPECRADYEKAREGEIEEYWAGINELMAQQYD